MTKLALVIAGTAVGTALAYLVLKVHDIENKMEEDRWNY